MTDDAGGRGRPTRDSEALLGALRFASLKHRDQRRKGREGTPFINHPIEVAELVARVGRVDDVVTLQSALLHDTIEDTETTPEEIEARFGPEVRGVVEEVTDDTSLPPDECKRRQVERAPRLSPRARLVKLADDISNVRAIATAPPAGWSLERRGEYLDWTERVVAGLRGASPALEALYDESLRAARAALAHDPGS